MNNVDRYKIFNKLSKMINSLSEFRREIVVVCVGTDSVLGDCFGPLTGQMLVSNNVDAFVYGTLDAPITAINADETTVFIGKKHPNAIVIAVDSAVGLSQNIGRINVSFGKLYPASALNKQLLGLGDICVMATVCDCAPTLASFSSVRLGLSHSLALVASSILSECIYMYNYTSKRQDSQSLTPCLSIRI